MTKQISKFGILSAMLLAAGLFHVSAAQADTGSSLVISEIYGGGGTTTATSTYNYDFVQLFNRSNADINLSGYSIQYASATGSFNNGLGTTTLSGTVKAHDYFLIQEGTVSKYFTTALPSADLVGTLNLSATNGKVALVSGVPLNNVSNPSAGTFVDLIGYGNATNTAGFKVGALSNTTALIRDNGGNADTFTIAAPYIMAAVPEPESYAMLMAGLGLLGFLAGARSLIDPYATECIDRVSVFHGLYPA